MSHCVASSFISNSHAIRDLHLLRKSQPVVHSITNLVTMQTIANILLSIGASPLMAHAHEELLDIAQLSQALVINIGTLDEGWLAAIEMAQHHAQQRPIPIIFDPVGAGASRYRTTAAKKILQTGVSILRANASEIIALTDSKEKNCGIDSQHLSNDAIDAAKTLCQTYNCTIVISGQQDIIIDTTRMLSMQHGTPLFTKVTGMGCSVTALIGAFAAINQDPFLAATHAMAIFTLAGEKAQPSSNGPGSFFSALLDALYSFEERDLDTLQIHAVQT